MDLWCLCTLMFSLCFSANAIMFNLPPNAQKCLQDEFQQNVSVIGEYEISKAPGQKVDYIVKNLKDNTLAQKEDISKGNFSFNMERYDIYEICFKSRVPQGQRGITQEVSLITKHVDIDVKKNDAFGEAANKKPIENNSHQ